MAEDTAVKKGKSKTEGTGKGKRGVTAATLFKHLSAYLDGRSDLNDQSTIVDLKDAIRDDVVEEAIS